MTETRFRQAFLLLLVAAISAAFVAMIRAFLLTILLAAIFAGLSYPVYEWMLGRVRGRTAFAAIATLLLLLVLVMAPLLAVLGAGANEALRVTETIRLETSGEASPSPYSAPSLLQAWAMCCDRGWWGTTRRLFGAMGFILGPILAALFVTVWEMFGIAFRTALAEPASAPADDRERRSR